MSQNLRRYLVNEVWMNPFNPLNAKLNPICHLLALLRAHHILHISRTRVHAGRRVLSWGHEYT